MKKIVSLVMVVLLLGVYGLFALGSGESKTDDQGTDSASETKENSNLGSYKVDIVSCRFAKDYEGKKVAIVKYTFTNHSEDPSSFFVAFDDNAYQNGVGLNEAYFLDDSANYSSDNQTKEIKKDASIDVEVAYVLNDSTTPLEIEVKQLFSFDDSTVTKTFEIS